MFAYRKLTGVAFFGLLAFALHAEANSGGAEQMSLGPVQAGSFKIGPTHVVAYYLPDAGQCAVTAVVEEIIDDEPSSSPARLRFSLAPGARAFIDNAGGRSVALECAAGAEALTIEHQQLNTALVEQTGS